MNYILRRVALLLLSSGMIWTAAACAKTGRTIRFRCSRVMEAQQAAWNRGDIEAFMDGYERADSTTFIWATSSHADGKPCWIDISVATALANRWER
jgi:hypothetical protein